MVVVIVIGAHDIVGNTMLQADLIEFFNWRKPCSRPMTLGSTQPLTEMNTRNLPGGKGRVAGA
jgi:hypothetical protein